MKINKKKITVTTLALAMGAALAGSISGSVAWYQYSTRAAAQINGTSAGTSRNLYVKSAQANESGYQQQLTFSAKNFRPASFRDNSGTDEFYDHPVYGYAAQTKIGSGTGEIANEQTIGSVATVAYAEYSLYFKVEDYKNSSTAEQAAKDVYLSRFELEYTTASGTADITPAVRVRISGNNEAIIASAEGTTKTNGQLDLNHNGSPDKDGILVDDQDSTLSAINYYAGAADSEYDTVLASSFIPTTTNPYTFTGKDDKDIATTSATLGEDSNEVKVQIWIEGWEKLASSVIWSEDYFAQNFEVRMQFQCEADVA